ncbi:MAG: 4Fe-4S binding protein [Rhodocyclales bacterium]|nr:4Fe-4S binding protein [Rhodocyclales bacterium]
MDAATHTLHYVSPARAGRLARLGDAMARHRRLILGLQWVVVLGYGFLVAVPAFLPLPPQGATMLDNLTLFAQFVFWGIWWPGVILSTMLLGRVWCGVLCPEGALAEFASRRGLGKAIPRWLRWSGWPFFAFVATTVYGQLVSVYEYPKAALLVLGGSTVAAVAIGFVYGQGKRVWCRYLCPVSGVFALLSRVAPLHFRVDQETWKRYPARTAAVDCAPLLDVRHLKGNAQCHSCGRCSGHRDAVQLAARSPNAEILAGTPRDVRTSEALLLVFGLLGVAVAAFQWTVSPWFVALKQTAAEWLVEREWFLPLEDNAPWWLLTHYPEVNDAFTWLDGALILAYIGGGALTLGGAIWLSLLAAARIASRIDWRVLATGLVPLGGLGVFLGLSMLTLTQLRAEGISFGWLGEARAALLAGAIGWSAWLGLRLLGKSAKSPARVALAAVFYALPLLLVGGAWYLVFFAW